MKKQKTIVEPAALRARIRSTGLRCTAARFTVLRHLNQAETPLSHAEVADALAGHGFDRATIYRNLIELAEVGVRSRVELGDHVWRFEMRGEGRDHQNDHPHFLCVECGEVSCLNNVSVTVKPPRGTKRGFFGEVTEVLLKGRCNDCS
jgi:Fur family transcriptional regulator, ferric uptake regulator